MIDKSIHPDSMGDNKNKLEKLERKVRELEREIEKLPDKDEVISDIKNRLMGYEDGIRTDEGSLTMKKNFILENRKAIRDRDDEGGIDPQKDNVVPMYFNEKRDGRLNHIFIGDASVEGFFNTSVFSASATQKEDVDLDNLNNGTLQLLLMKERDNEGDVSYKSKPSAMVIMGGVEPYYKQIPGVDNPEDSDGAFFQSVGTGEHGFSSISHQDLVTQIPNTAVSTYKDSIMGQVGSNSGFVGLIHIGPEAPPETGQWIWVDTSE